MTTKAAEGTNANLWSPEPDAFALLQEYMEPTIRPLIGAKTIQILLLREALDYLILRTEDTREINEVVTPSARDGDGGVGVVREVSRVAFLGGKQKAVESRECERVLREHWKALPVDQAKAAVASILGRPEKKEDQEKQQKAIDKLNCASEAHVMAQAGHECFLKDDLCLRCPRCGLFGATSTESGKGQEPNIKHRIEYSTAFSLLPYEEVREEMTFNAINDDKQITGQALGSRPSVRPGTLFASIVTLRSATPHELMLVLKVLLSARSYGAEARTAGDMRNHIVGIVGGWEEVLTPLEFTLECESRLNDVVKEGKRLAAIDQAVSTYWGLCANKSKVVLIGAMAADQDKPCGQSANESKVVNADDRNEPGKLRTHRRLGELLKAVQDFEIDQSFLERAYQDVAGLRAAQGA